MDVYASMDGQEKTAQFQFAWKIAENMVNVLMDFVFVTLDILEKIASNLYDNLITFRIVRIIVLIMERVLMGLVFVMKISRELTVRLKNAWKTAWMVDIALRMNAFVNKDLKENFAKMKNV